MRTSYGLYIRMYIYVSIYVGIVARHGLWNKARRGLFSSAQAVKYSNGAATYKMAHRRVKTVSAKQLSGREGGEGGEMGVSESEYVCVPN